MQKRMYCKLQLKRAFRYYPAVLAVTVLLAVGISAVAVVLLNRWEKGEAKLPIDVGLVGDTEGTYLNIGIDTLSEVDSIGASVTFHRVSEKQAREQLVTNELDAYIVVPDGFVESIYTGENDPLLFVMKKKPGGIGMVIAEEVIQMLGHMVTESQSAVYGMQELVAERSQKNPYKQGDYLSARYISTILQREESYEIVQVDGRDGVSIGGYYIAGALIFFLLLWGVTCSAYMTNKNIALSRVLAAGKCGSLSQTLSEYVSYAVPGFLSLLILCAVVGIVFGNKTLPVEELSESGFSAYFLLAWKLFPAFLVLTAMQYFLYEIVSGTVSALLVQFLTAIGLGYISGCFYPDSFFPVVIRQTAEILPSGVAFRYARQLLSESVSVLPLLLMLAYTILFLGCSALVRRRRIEGEGL